MILKYESTDERRFELRIDFYRLSEAIRKACCRIRFMIAHELTHNLLELFFPLFLMDEELPSVYDRLISWFNPHEEKASKSENRHRAIVYSEVLNVLFRNLAEQAAHSYSDVLRSTLPRHQDRGSGDIVSHNDNSRRNYPKPALTAVHAT